MDHVDALRALGEVVRDADCEPRRFGDSEIIERLRVILGLLEVTASDEDVSGLIEDIVMSTSGLGALAAIGEDRVARLFASYWDTRDESLGWAHFLTQDALVELDVTNTAEQDRGFDFLSKAIVHAKAPSTVWLIVDIWHDADPSCLPHFNKAARERIHWAMKEEPDSWKPVDPADFE